MARQQVQPVSMGIAIEFGEMTSGLNAVLGSAMGVASEKRLGAAVGKIASLSDREFARLADSLAKTELQHMYEYGPLYGSVIGGPRGRLWEITWPRRAGDLVGNIVFLKSKRLSPPHPKVVARSKSGVASHKFPDKARHLEETETIESTPGVRNFTTRVGGPGKEPTQLVYVDSSGDVKFSKFRRRRNEFYGRFRQLFAAYWAGQVEFGTKTRVQAATKTTMDVSRAAIVKTARRGVNRVPVMPPGRSGVFTYDHGKPFMGFVEKPSIIKEVSDQVGKTIEKELTRQWQRAL